MPNNSVNKDLASIGQVLLSTGRLEELLNFRDIVAFSQTCRAAQEVSTEARKKQALKSLLTAVVEGYEDVAIKIITSIPELLLDSSAILNISGKEIKGLTPLQIAICAGDADMVQMMQYVLKDLQRDVQRGIQLNFEPESEIQRQFIAIYSGGVHSVETAQKLQAQNFKTNLNEIFVAICIATDKQVAFELKTSGRHNADSSLNMALHKFRAQFAAISNQEQIFNPFYWLMALELYNEQFDNFIGSDTGRWCRRDLFWQQVLGYIGLHFPRRYWQAYNQRGIYYSIYRSYPDYFVASDFKLYCEEKNQVLRSYEQSRGQGLPLLPAKQIRNKARYSCCNIS